MIKKLISVDNDINNVNNHLDINNNVSTCDVLIVGHNLTNITNKINKVYITNTNINGCKKNFNFIGV